ncbi:hypothetical protein O5853_30450, partial [Escherichia coli]|nr:hypothetical protein [Escherichia coli]
LLQPGLRAGLLLQAFGQLGFTSIGYQTALPFDTAARAWDYTPPLKTHEPRAGKPALPPRKTGGNDVFRQLLTETMVPQTEANLKID